MLLLSFAALAQPTPPAPPTPRPPAAQTPAPPPHRRGPRSPLPNVWLPKPVADLVGLDKVTARTTPLTCASAKPGRSARCPSRCAPAKSGRPISPPTPPHSSTSPTAIRAAPAFHGWMVVSDPAVSMLEHPIYDVRLAGCHE